MPTGMVPAEDRASSVLVEVRADSVMVESRSFTVIDNRTAVVTPQR